MINEFMSLDDFVKSCKENGLDWAKSTLREYVVNDEPLTFCDGSSTKAMCRVASDAITGDDSLMCLSSKYGMELYFHMWTSEQ